MNFKIKNHRIRIIKNDYNKRYWHPIGHFFNLTSVLIGETWYKCGLDFTRKDNRYFIRLSNPLITEPNSNIIIKFHNRGIYQELEISKFRYNILKYLKNDHPFNHWEYKMRLEVFQRKNTLFAFTIAFILATGYYLVNHYDNNSLMTLIAENNWIQTIIIFLTLSSFINIFHPFTVRKEINQKDVENISRETFEKSLREKEQIEKIRREARI